MTRYQTGAQLERQIVNRFREQGAIAFRVPGSKGFADIFIFTQFGIRMAIQVKKGKQSPGEKHEAIKKFLEYRNQLALHEVHCHLVEKIAGAEVWTNITQEVYGDANNM